MAEEEILTDAQIERYARHILLREVGGAGQRRLLASAVRIEGLSPEGAWAALYLALAGVGRLVLADPRPVPVGGMPPLIPASQVGAPRDAAALAALAAHNPDVALERDGEAAPPDGGSLLRPGNAELPLVVRAAGRAALVGWTEAPPCPICAPVGEATPEAAALAGSLAASRALGYLLFGAAPRGLVRLEAGREEALGPCPHR